MFQTKGIDIDLLVAPVSFNHPRHGPILQDIAFLLPHEVLNFLYQNPAAWTHAILGGDAQAHFGDFWQHYPDSTAEWFIKHRIATLNPEDRSKTIPIVLHGDDVHVYKTSARYKVLTTQWNSFFSHQLGRLLSRFCMFTIPYNLMFSATSMELLLS